MIDCSTICDSTRHLPRRLRRFEAQLSGGLALDPSAQDLLFLQAQTANAFTDAPVTDAQIKAIYDLIKWGPTGMNSQPLRIVLIRSPEARERLVQRMAPGNRAKTLAAPLVAVLAADLDFHDELPKTFPVFPGARDAMPTRNDASRRRLQQCPAADRLLHRRCPGRRAGRRSDGRLRRRGHRSRVLPRRPPPGDARRQHRPAVGPGVPPPSAAAATTTRSSRAD